MPRFLALRHCAAALLMLLMLGLGGCGQTGPLFLRMPEVTLPELAPFSVGEPATIFLPEGVTLPAPVSATRLPPVATTRAVPYAATLKTPSAVTRP